MNVVALRQVRLSRQLSGDQPQESIEKFGDDTSLDRLARPTHLAPVSVLLASQEPGYSAGYDVTGDEGRT